MILFVIGLFIVLFFMLVQCITSIKDLSFQVKELKKQLDQQSFADQFRKAAASKPENNPPQAAAPAQVGTPTQAGTPTQTGTPAQAPASERPPAESKPQEVNVQTPAGTKPVPAFLLKKESEAKIVAPPEQKTVTAAPGTNPKSEPVQMSAPQQPKDVLVHHFPGFSQRITPGAQPVAPVSAPKKPERSPIEARTAEALSKMWQWFSVGEEYRPGGMTKEYAIATTWMLRAAVILLVLGLAYFIKYSHQRNLLPPELRLSVAVLFALVIVGIGCKLLNRAKYRIFGTALTGAGFAGLYLCVFASVSIYHLLGMWVGLVGMAVLTAAGAALALRFDSIFLAMLAVCGGFLAPVLMNSGSRNLVALFSYMGVLVLGSLVIARRRSWQAVNILTFLFTWGIYIAVKPFPRDLGSGTNLGPWITRPQWAVIGDGVNRTYALAVAAGALFFLAFCVQTVAFNLFSRRKVSLLELGSAALNGIVFMSVALPPTIAIYGREYAAIVSFAGALVYLLQLALLRKMKLEDRNLLLTLLVFGCGLIALTFPLLLKQDHLAVAWAAQAAAMLYIACRSKSVILARLSYIVYLIAAVRLLGFDLAHGYVRHMQGFWTRMMNFGSYTAALAGGFFMLKRYAAELAGSSVSGDGAAAVSGARYPLSSKVMFWCAFAVSFITIVGEFTFWDQMEDGGLVATAALYLLLLSLVPRLFRENTQGIINAGAVLLCTFIAIVLIAWPTFEPTLSSFMYCFFPFLWSVVALVFAGVLFGRFGLEAGAPARTAKSAKSLSVFFIVSAMAIWFLYSTDELGFMVEHFSSRGGARIAVSLLWGFYALLLLAFGILRGKRTVRIAALALFAITVLKIFFFDLAGTPALYRVAGCMVTGAALVAGAWLYARFEQKGDSPNEPRS